MLDLDAIEARAEAATPGPWMEPRNGLGLGWTIFPKNSKGWSIATCDSGTDADFIAHARTDIPNLLAALDELEAENKELKLDLAAAEHYTTDDLTSPARLCVKCRRPWPCEFTSVQVGKNRTMERTA